MESRTMGGDRVLTAHPLMRARRTLKTARKALMAMSKALVTVRTI